MRLLDLFCGGGGAGRGYRDAGFDVTGVDVADHSDYYPGRFVRADALEYLAEHGHEYDAIHASPPCQRYSTATADRSRHPDLVGPTRAALFRAGRPWVMENVVGAPMRRDLLLCGSHFGLTSGGYLLRRHRVFELDGFHVPQPKCSCARRPIAGVYGNLPPASTGFHHYHNGERFHGLKFPVPHAQAVMGVDLPPRILVQAIPPAYTAYIGQYLAEAVALGPESGVTLW